MIDLTGQKFGRLTVLEPTDKRIHGNVVWMCCCDCGNACKISSNDLRTGNTKSCGCGHVRHGHNSRHMVTPEYHSWHGMKQRCLNPKQKAYKNYGGRGVAICERWLKFENFFEDVGERPDGFTLDRIDNDGDYEPSNCRWATRTEQNTNTRRMKWFCAYNILTGESHKSNNQVMFAGLYGLTPSAISTCLHGRRKTHKGWKFRYEKTNEYAGTKTDTV